MKNPHWKAPLGFRDTLVAEAISILGVQGAFAPYDTKPRKGDIVSLQSAPPTIWQLSIYEGEEPVLYDDEGIKRQFDTKRRLRALGTDQLCDWTNVGIRVLSRTWFDHPRWRWTEAQFNFDRRWRAEGYRADLHWLLQGVIDFEGRSATCQWRWRHGLGKEEDLPAAVKIDDIGNVTRSALREAVMAAVAHQKAVEKRRRREQSLNSPA